MSAGQRKLKVMDALMHKLNHNEKGKVLYFFCLSNALVTFAVRS